MMQAVRRENVSAAKGKNVLKTNEVLPTSESSSMNEVIQCSIISLEKECSFLKEKIESKQKIVNELLTNCSKQSSNLVKINSEEEQVKVKKQIEIQKCNNIFTKYVFLNINKE